MTQQTTSTAPARKAVPQAVRDFFRGVRARALDDALNGIDDEPGLDDGTGSTTGGAVVADNDASRMGGDDDNHTHIHIHSGAEAAQGAAPSGDMEARLGALESAVSQILEMLQGGGADPAADVDGMPAGDDPGDAGGDVDQPADPASEDDPNPTRDSAALATAYTNLISDAEILVPGFRAPTFDAASSRRRTIDNMCSQRRRVLDMMSNTPGGLSLLASVAPSQDFAVATADCATTATVFRAAAVVQRALNNAAATRDSGAVQSTSTKKSGPMTIKELNAFNKAYYAAKDAAK